MKRLLDQWNNLVADPVGIYRTSAALVNLDETFKTRFLELQTPRTFIYGENSLSEKPGEIKADASNPKELEKHGIDIEVISNAGHGFIFENLEGTVNVLKKSIEKHNLVKVTFPI